jgi:quinol monooxygenase YgiN
MIVALLRVVAPAGRQAELVRMMSALLEPTRAQPGCVEARLYVDADDPSALTMMQEWSSQADLDRFLASDSCKVVVAALETSMRVPDVRFDTIASRGGLEVIAMARSDVGKLRYARDG